MNDPFQNFIGQYTQPLDAIFRPKSVAVIGAKDTVGSVGRTIMVNLTTGHFPGALYPINPKRSEVLGLKAYPSIASLPEAVDLAVIVTPAHTVPGLVAECVAAGVKAAIIISAGFKELGPPGLKLEQAILEYAKKGNLRIIGPNCLGVMNPIYRLNATFAKGMALPGNIAFLSQSGAMCTAVLDWSFEARIGFSAFVSVGSMADVNWGDLIDYLGEDHATESILIYMETIGNPRAFLSAAREIALKKPIIVIKAGRSQEAATAAASHTGSLAGSDEVFDAALERVGVLRVNTIGELFNMASLLGRQPRPKGPRLSIVTNAGGPSVLATDAAVLHGAKIAPLDPTTISKLDEFLPAAWSHANPVDILGDAGPERYAKTIEVLAKDPNSDGILVALSPQDMTDALATAECLRPYADLKDKPIIASWMGGATVKSGSEILNQANIPTFAYPDDAAKCFALMWQYQENLNTLYEMPVVTALDDSYTKTSHTKQAHDLIDKVRQEKRTLLTEFESKKLLSLYGIPTVETLIAKNVQEAVSYAEQLHYPVVLKLLSETITHKSDIGGVKLNLQTSVQVQQAFNDIQQAVPPKDFQGVTVQPMIKMDGYELILGSSVDPQFGPVILFGMGGVLVEIFKDRALSLPPLNKSLARKLMHKTKIYHALKGVRGRKAVDLEALEEILVRFSFMIVENPWIQECDINPFLASPTQMLALDARVVLKSENEPAPQLAIRPYPAHYIVFDKLKNGVPLTLRPIRPEDEPLLIAFHRELSEKSLRLRYFEFISLSDRTAHDRLVRICFNDYDRNMAVVAEVQEGETRKIIGIGRLIRSQGTNTADLKMVIADDYHNLGLGTQLMKHLIEIARAEHLGSIQATILSENEGMIKICKNLGFKIKVDEINKLTYAQISLCSN